MDASAKLCRLTWAVASRQRVGGIRTVVCVDAGVVRHVSELPIALGI
jgi:hypothetical protein